MVVIVGGREYHCEPGDRLMIPGNTPHEAFVGTEAVPSSGSRSFLRRARPDALVPDCAVVTGP